MERDPSYAEILEFIRRKIGTEQFTVEVKKIISLPTAEELWRDGCYLQYVGKVAENQVIWLKRTLIGSVLTIFVMFHDGAVDCQKIYKNAPIAFQKIAKFADLTAHKIVSAADGYIVSYPENVPGQIPTATPDPLNIHVHQSIRISSSSSSSSGPISLSPGSGMIPYSNQWGDLNQLS